MRIDLRKGLTIPLAGAPQQAIGDTSTVNTVALLGRDYVGLRPRMSVAVGDRVRLGQTLFEDKRTPGVSFTAPGSGVVSAINRGARRVLQSVVISLDGDDEMTFDSYTTAHLPKLGRDKVRDVLVASGLWTALRARPYSKIPPPDSAPHSIFVTAVDTNPLAADPAVVIEEYRDDFAHGLSIVAQLTEGKVFVCAAAGADLACPDDTQFQRVEIVGPHPAGLVGTHIHLLAPVGKTRTVWHLNYQDVIAIGRLFTTGHIWTERIVALAGPQVERPRLLRTRLGASTEDLVQGELSPGDARVVSGSLLSGHRASEWAAHFGRYHLQVCVLPEGQQREFLNWAMPGTKKFSAVRAFAGHLLHRRPFRLTTSQNGSPRAMVPIGNFERVMPLDILPAPLLKALLVGDTESAQALGCLELDEEDLALCSFVCSGKYEYGPELRSCLDEIERLS